MIQGSTPTTSDDASKVTSSRPALAPDAYRERHPAEPVALDSTRNRRQILNAAPLLRGLVADDAGGQHDVARPAARPAEADEHPVAARPVFGGQPVPAICQRQRRRARRAVPGRVPAVPLRVRRKPAPPHIRRSERARANRHPAAAFRFSFALMCSFFSASACGLNRDEARSMKSIANETPASNLFFSHGRSIRSRIGPWVTQAIMSCPST